MGRSIVRILVQDMQQPGASGFRITQVKQKRSRLRLQGQIVGPLPQFALANLPQTLEVAVGLLESIGKSLRLVPFALADQRGGQQLKNVTVQPVTTS
jgi:hypothetical protein